MSTYFWYVPRIFVRGSSCSTNERVWLAPRICITQVDIPSVCMAGAPAQMSKAPIISRARAAGLQETCHRYGLGVQKLREERATVGMHNKIVPVTKRIHLHEKCVAIRKLVATVWAILTIRIMATHVGQHGFM